jgi:hypothetical protein
MGRFSLGGLDSGDYKVTYGTIDSLWSLTTTQGSIQAHFTNKPDSVSITMGFHRNWDDVTGVVYYDLNEDFTREPGEPGVGGWKVTLRGATIDTTVSDSTGNYILPHVSLGADTVGIIAPPGWEVIYPEYYYHIIVIPTAIGFFYPVAGFAVHPIPQRTKIFLNVHDNSNARMVSLAWGNRGGATFGIAGADPNATTFDFSEGELELPPSAFVVANGYFDVRFIDPRNGEGHFGNGSWVDMRDYVSPAQADTHLVVFYPGYSAGGNYPMTFTWDKAQVQSDYSGSVVLVDSLGNVTDMRLVDSLVVSNPAVSWLRLISRGPNLPASSSLSWRLVSVPSQPLVNNISELFSLPQSELYGFSKRAGYSAAPSLFPGVGYWLKFVAPVGVSSVLSALPSLPETLSVSAGWNLVGGPGQTISTGAVSSSPPGIIGNIFDFNSGYSLADSVRPFEGYWVNAAASGSMIFGGGAAKNTSSASAAEIMSRATEIDIADARGFAHPLRLYTPQPHDGRLPDASEFELPPAPPSGIPDVRFASGRCLEYEPAGTTAEYTIQIGGSGVFPLTISEGPNSHSTGTTISVKAGNKYVALGKNTSVTVTAQAKTITVRVTTAGDPSIPKEFALEQNYPNPFNPSTTLKYDLPVTSNVRLDVYDILGRLVKTLAEGVEAAGYKQVEWNAANVGSGAYFYRIEATGVADQSKHFTKAMKMVVVK